MTRPANSGTPGRSTGGTWASALWRRIRSEIAAVDDDLRERIELQFGHHPVLDLWLRGPGAVARASRAAIADGWQRRARRGGRRPRG